jgi:protein TonB
MKKLLATYILCVIALTALAQNQDTKVKRSGIPIAEHYEGGEEALVKFIEEKMVYPVMAKRNRIQGTCIISLKLDEFGKGSDFKIVKNIGGTCGEEALRLVQMLKFNAPGYSAIYSIPVNFVIK